MTPDPTTPDTELPQPPRDPLDSALSRDESGETPSDHRYDFYVEQEDAQDTQNEPRALRRTLGDKRLNVTHAKAIVDRLRVMEDRFESYRALLAQFGVDEHEEVRGLKLQLQETLNELSYAEMRVREAYTTASEVLDTLENL